MTTTFLTESLFVFGMLAGLGLAGGFLVLPFLATRRFIVLAAPLAGLLVVSLGTAALYSISARPFAFCATASAALCCAATSAAFFFLRTKPSLKNWLLPVAAAVIIVPLVTFATDAATIHLGQPALLYTDGTDHLGYAQMADWLSTHRVDEPPRYTAEEPYEAFPSYLFGKDPRFGCFFALTLIKSVRGYSGAFTYDVACAVILSAGILALAGVFSRSFLSLLVLLPGLLSCHWYDYSRGGYLGKLMGYPAVLFVAGLFLSADVRSPVMMFVLVILTAAVALMHSGTVTAFFLLVIVGGYLLSELAMAPKLERSAKLKEVVQLAAALLALMVVAVVATGAPARPFQSLYPDYGVKWDYILPRVLDLENQGARLTSFSPIALNWMLAGAFGVWLALIVAAVRLRDSAAAGLLIGPLLLLVVMLAVGARAAALQMIGTFYPFSVCAAALLIERAALVTKGSSLLLRVFAQAVVLLLSAACVGLRVPRLQGAIDRYAGKDDPGHARFCRADADRLASLMVDQPVQVDVVDPPQLAIFALTEFGRREHIHLQWSARSWNTTVGYARWPVPRFETPRLRLVAHGEPTDLRVMLRTPQYDLLDCSAAVAAAPTTAPSGN